MARPPMSNKERARQPLTLDDAAAELAELGVSRDALKCFAAAGRLALYRLGAKRFVQRAELERFRGWISERIAADPDWLAIEVQRARGRKGGNVRRVVIGASAPPPRKVALTESKHVLPARVVTKAPPSRPAKVATFADAPRPTPPRVIERGRR